MPRRTWTRAVQDALGAPRPVGKPAVPAPGTEPDHTRVGVAAKAIRDTGVGPKTGQVFPVSLRPFTNVGGVTMRHSVEQALPMINTLDASRMMAESILSGYALMESALDAIPGGGHLMRDAQAYHAGARLKMDAARYFAAMYDKNLGLKRVEDIAKVVEKQFRELDPARAKIVAAEIQKLMVTYIPEGECRPVSTLVALPQPSPPSPRSSRARKKAA